MGLVCSSSWAATESEPHAKVKVCGTDEVRCADVILDAGVNKLQTNATVQIEQLLGQTVYPHTWFFVFRGATSDTFTVNIPDESISEPVTQNVADTTDDLFAERVKNELNANGTFSALFTAKRMINTSLILIEAKEVDVSYPDANDFNVSSTGTITYLVGYDTIIRRGVPLAIFPHPKDPRVGTINIGGGTIVPTLGTNLVYEDMEVASGGIARGTSITVASGWNQLYSFTGNGLLLGIMTTVEDLGGTDANYWQIRLVIDGVEIFGTNGISGRDMTNGNLYNWNTGTTPSPTWGGLNIVQNTFRFDAPNNLPITFSSSVKVYIRRQGTTTRVWRAGLVAIVKEGT